MITKVYPFIFVLFFYFLAFIVRSYLFWKNTGINPITFDNSDDAHSFNGQLFKIISILEVVGIAIYSFGGANYAYLLPIWYLEIEWLSSIGWVLLHLSLVWIFVAQVQMSDSWRIGIDTQHLSPLVTKGLFSLSRNPIFLGILIANLGLFFVLPNALTLLLIVWSYTVLQTQVRLEESFLQQTHEEVYENYRRAVRRWI